MTAPLAAPREVATQRPAPGDEYHLFCCCDQNRGLCGADLTHVPITERGDDTPCPMCFSLEDAPCPWCGCEDCEEDA